MTVTTVEVAIARAIDRESMARSLAARGFAAQVCEHGLTLEVGHSRDGADIAHELEMCLAEQSLPYVPTPLNDGVYVLRPPAG
jgi:hypothetical protein